MKGKQNPGGAAISGIHMDGKMKKAGPVDKSTAGTPASTEGTFGGSATNLAHSLSGSSANQKGNT